MARRPEPPKKPRLPRQRIPLPRKTGRQHGDERREASRLACRRGLATRENGE
jgi:hypothetical protein